ncbi:MAG: winged helix-turn-helix transcriptional regulator [Kineosporiaceae bacterium]|nr:winged helix-turn-helix transcriptional regulator [Kineosporiaceae bacterium]
MTIFAALAEPRRRDILELLRDGERSVGELVAALGLAQPTVSQHLRVLRDAGLVTVRADATRRLYRLRPAALIELDAWLEPYRRLWSGRLDALERLLDTEAPLDATPENAAESTSESAPAVHLTDGERP